MPNPTLTWTTRRPGLWLSDDGRYAIVEVVLPEARHNPTVVYQLRKLAPDMQAAYPASLGYFVAERYRLEEVQALAENDAYCDAHSSERSVPETYPALAMSRFFWPISQGTTRAALVVDRDGERLVARVVGMARGEDEFRPVAYAEVDLADAVASG